MKPRLSPLARTTSGAGMAVWLAVAMFPFLWMILISFRKPVDAFATPPKLFAPFTFEHFHHIWVVDGFLAVRDQHHDRDRGDGSRLADHRLPRRLCAGALRGVARVLAPHRRPRLSRDAPTSSS